MGRILMDEQDMERAAFEQGRMVPAVLTDDGSALLTKRMVDFGESEATAMENLEWYQEAMAAAVASGAQTSGQDAFGMTAKWFEIAAKMAQFKTPKDFYFGWKMLLWRMNQPIFDDLLNHQTPADWWRPMGISKEMAYRKANELGDALGLPRRDDQRSIESRAKMVVARKKK